MQCARSTGHDRWRESVATFSTPGKQASAETVRAPYVAPIDIGFREERFRTVDVPRPGPSLALPAGQTTTRGGV